MRVARDSSIKHRLNVFTFLSCQSVQVPKRKRSSTTSGLSGWPNNHTKLKEAKSYFLRITKRLPKIIMLPRNPPLDEKKQGDVYDIC